MILWNSKAKTKWEVAFAFFTFLKQNNQKKISETHKLILVF